MNETKTATEAAKPMETTTITSEGNGKYRIWNSINDKETFVSIYDKSKEPLARLKEIGIKQEKRQGFLDDL